jgi:hypothetical protein
MKLEYSRPKNMNGESETNQENKNNDHIKPRIIVRFWHSLRRRRVWLKIGDHPKSTIAEKIGVFLAFCLLIVGGVQAYIYWRQTRVMQTTLGQNERGIMLNMGQLAIANRNAKTSQDSLDASKNQFGDTLTQLKESNAINRASLESVQRAFLVLGKIDSEITDQTVSFGFHWDNSGVTPTRGYTHVSYSYDSKELADDFSFPDKWSEGASHINGSFVVGPKADTIIWVGKIPMPIIEAAHSTPRGMYLYFWGWTVYRDIFRNDHLTEFCVEYVPDFIEGDKDSRKLHYRMNNYIRHNCYDKDCPDYQKRIRENRPRLAKALR